MVWELEFFDRNPSDDIMEVKMENIWIKDMIAGIYVVIVVSFILSIPMTFKASKWLEVYQNEGREENYNRYKRYDRIWIALMIIMLLSGVVAIIVGVCNRDLLG